MENSRLSTNQQEQNSDAPTARSFMKRGRDRFGIPSLAFRALPLPSGKPKRTRPNRARLHFQVRYAHGWNKKVGGEIALSFPTTLRLQILTLERFCGVRQVSLAEHGKTAPCAICGVAGVVGKTARQRLCLLFVTIYDTCPIYEASWNQRRRKKYPSFFIAHLQGRKWCWTGCAGWTRPTETSSGKT